MKHKQLALDVGVIKEIKPTTLRKTSIPNKPFEPGKSIGFSSIIGSNNLSFQSKIEAH
jgi:hypothetical protein